MNLSHYVYFADRRANVETVAEVPVSASVRSGIDNSAVIIYYHGNCHALSVRRSLMSLRPQIFYLDPEDTARIARAANPKGNIYLQMYDAFGTIFMDQRFAALFPTHGQPAVAPVRLALTTLMQFAEGLTDRQAADAVRTRLDWKYLLCLDLTDPGFHFSVLSAFRDSVNRWRRGAPAP